MRKILLDGLAFETGDGGFTTAFRDVLSSSQNIRGVDFTLICRKGMSSALPTDGIKVVEVIFPRQMRYFAGQFIAPLYAAMNGIDLIHSEISAAPIFSTVPTSLTVHDLYFLIDNGIDAPGIKGRIMNWYWKKLFVTSIRRSSKIKTISETSLRDIEKLVAPKAPIEIIFPRVGPFKEAERARSSREVPLKILIVGSLVPRKNTGFLLEALRYVNRDWELHIVGQLWWGAAALSPYVGDPRVHVHGFVSDEQLEHLYRDCDVLVSPSKYEGFGLPVAEALLRDVAVLASDIPAYAEMLPASARFSLENPADLAGKLESFDSSFTHPSLEGARILKEKLRPETHIDSHRNYFSA